MKKLLGISVVAMLAVSPMMANADPTQYTDTTATTGGLASTATGVNVASQGKYYKSATITTDDQSHIASTAYVKGAYNSAVGMINKIAADSATDAGEGLVKSNGKFSVDLKKQDINNVSTNVSGLKLDGTGDAAQLMVDADGSTVEINETSHKVGVKAGGITSTQLANSAVTSGKIDTGAVAFSNVASADIVTSTTNTNGIRATDSASDSLFVTEKAVAKAVEAATSGASNALAQAGGDGLAWDDTDNELDIDLADESGLKIGTGDDAGKLMVNAGNGVAINATSGALEAKLDGGTLANSSSGLKVASSGITSTELANNAVTTDKINDGAVTAAKLAPGVISSSVSTVASGAAGYDAWNGNATVASEKAVATEVANLKTGVAATINAATIKLYTTWGDDTSNGEGNAASGTLTSSGYTQGS